MDRIPMTATELNGSTLETEEVEVEEQEYLDFQTYRPKLDALKKDWNSECTETERRRRIRKIDVDVEALRQQGKLKADETLIGVRVIDENIRKEQPLFVNYLTQSERLAIFETTEAGVNTKPLETSFTKGMSYSGMLKNLYKTIDGAQAHGWDSVEVTYDPSKPLKTGIEHIGHENLMFSWQARDHQADEVVMRRFKVTESQLRKWVKKHGFDQTQVDNLLRLDGLNNTIPNPIEIFKVFCKHDDIVYVSWCSLDGSKTTDWLKKPTPLDLGRKRTELKTQLQPVDVGGVTLMQPTQVPVEIDETETLFPIFIYVYMEAEEQCITEQKGRIFFDRPWQDAQIALRTLVINGAVRASNVYGSPKMSSATGAKITKLDLTVEHGCFYSEPMEFWRTEYPDPAILRAADSLDTRKAAETGQTASAVINRDDARKTAKELDSAETKDKQLSMTPLMLFSNFMREVLSFAWYIVQDQAKQNKIILLPKPQQILGQDGSVKIVNTNDPSVALVYDIKPAGDVDVVRRADMIQRMMGMLPIMQPTPAWVEFLSDLIRLVLPEYAEKYVGLIMQAEANKDQMILAMGTMLKEAVTDNNGTIKPEFAQHAGELQNMFAQLPQTQTNPQQENEVA